MNAVLTVELVKKKVGKAESFSCQAWLLCIHLWACIGWFFPVASPAGVNKGQLRGNKQALLCYLCACCDYSPQH